MKSFILVLCFLICLPAFAFQNQRGVGLSLGNPTGLNGKYWLDGNKAIDGGAAWSLGKHTNFSLHSDYLWHNEGAFFFNDVHSLDLYYGLGGRMEFADDIELGLRVPVGLAHKLENGAADVFAEAAPIIDFVSRTGLELHLLFGARYYF